MLFSSSTPLLRFLAVVVTVLFWHSSSLATPAPRDQVIADVKQTFNLSRAGIALSERSGLLADAMSDIARTAI
jgi:hypothetical protein